MYPKNQIHFYYLTGPDGSGKTTFLETIQQYFIEIGKEPIHIWLRSPKILSKPLMAICRLTGLTTYKTIDGVRYGAHEFYRSKLISWLFPLLQLIDFKIKHRLIIKKIKQTGSSIILIDRHALDTLADLMVDTHKFNLHRTWIGKALLKLIPKNTQIIMLRVNEDILRKRKKDTLYDPMLTEKIKVYEILSRDLRIKVIDNTKPFQSVKKDIFDYFDIHARH